MEHECLHLEKLESPRRPPVEPASEGCAECLAMGSDWVHLRLCMTCGHVGCCDSSPNRHATEHAHATRHPVIKSFEPGEDWAYCYPDDLLLGAIPTFRMESPAQHIDPPM